MATANYFIDAEDGWVAVTSGSTGFVAIRSNSPNHPFFVADGSSAPTTTPTAATGTITISGGQPSEDDTVTVNGTVFTFISGTPADDTEVEIGVDPEATHDNLIVAINTVLGGVVTAADTSATVITLTAVAGGTAGNSITLAEDADNTVVSGAALTGGVNPPLGFKVDCGEFWCDVSNSNNYYVRVLENLPQETRFDVFSIAGT